MSNCATLACGAVSGAKITAGGPTAAAIPANAAPAFPVDAAATVFTPCSSARATTTALARSLNDAVGLRPSSFTYTCLSPSPDASRSARYIGVQPTENNGFDELDGCDPRNSFNRLLSMGSNDR